PPAAPGAAQPNAQRAAPATVGLPPGAGTAPTPSGGYPQRAQPGTPPAGVSAAPAAQVAAGAARNRRVVWPVTGIAIVAVLGLAAAWFFLLGPGASEDGKSAGAAGEGGEAEQGKRFTQFHYSFVAPAGWVQTTDDSEARQMVVKSGNDTA